MLENNEIWKDCRGYEGLYQVSSLGRVWSVKTQRYLLGTKSKSGYIYVHLTAKNGKRKKERLHRLVAINFIPNLEEKTQVNHKDENKLNNAVSNLEWMTPKENCNYGTRNQRIHDTRKKNYDKTKIK